MEEDRAARWAELIATSLQVSGLSEADLERRLGWSPGSLGRLLDGEDDVAPDQILEILEELHESARPGRSGNRAQAPGFGDNRSQVVAELLDRFRLLGYELKTAEPPAAEASSYRELEKKVESILRRAYGEPPAGRKA